MYCALGGSQSCRWLQVGIGIRSLVDVSCCRNSPSCGTATMSQLSGVPVFFVKSPLSYEIEDIVQIVFATYA